MRIGIDASNLRAGGGRTHLVELLRHAEDVREPVEEVVVWGSRATLALLPERPWLRSFAEPLLERPLPLRLLWQVTRLPQLVRDVDLLFSPGGIAPATGRATVVMCQNTLLFDAKERRRFGHSATRARLEALRVAHRSSYRRADAVIFLTHHSEEAVRRDLRGAIRDSAVIPHGVGPRFLKSPRPARLPADLSISRPFRLVYVSAISVYKNHPELVAAIAALRSSTPVELLLIGPIESRAAWSAMNAAIDETRTRDVVHWLGRVPHEELSRRLVDADACVYPSTCETFPIALLEAMASGLPAAVSAIPANLEVCGDAAVAFDGRDPASIAGAMMELIMDTTKRSELAERGYQRARSFTWSRCATETFRFLARVQTRSSNRSVRAGAPP